MLIQSSVAHDLAGAASMEYLPTGLRCTIEFPFAEGVSDENGDETASRSPTAAKPD
jgi:hypothetical protein